jgi:hypothetical protein
MDETIYEEYKMAKTHRVFLLDPTSLIRTKVNASELKSKISEIKENKKTILEKYGYQGKTK